MLCDEADQVEKQKEDFSLLIMSDGLRLKVIDMFIKDYVVNKTTNAMVLKSKEIVNKQIISSFNNNESKSFTSEANCHTLCLGTAGQTGISYLQCNP